MSDHHRTADHDAHAAPREASGLKKITNVLVLPGLPRAVAGSLVAYYMGQSSGQVTASMSEQAVVGRIQMVGAPKFEEPKAPEADGAAAPAGAASAAK